jgi:hypothetical protein
VEHFLFDVKLGVMMITLLAGRLWKDGMMFLPVWYVGVLILLLYKRPFLFAANNVPNVLLYSNARSQRRDRDDGELGIESLNAHRSPSKREPEQDDVGYVDAIGRHSDFFGRPLMGMRVLGTTSPFVQGSWTHDCSL